MIKQALLTELKNHGFIGECKPGKYIQVSNNCFELAQFLAKKFGIRFPLSKKVMSDIIFNAKAKMLWQKDFYIKELIETKNEILIYEPEDVIGPVHVVLKASGQEYNFGCSEEHGFEVSVRIPLLS